MKSIKIQKLTFQAFKPFGSFHNLLDNEGLAASSVMKQGFFPDIIQLNFGKDTLPTVNVCHVQRSEKNIINFVEAHQYTCEGLLPIDSDVIIFVGTVMHGNFDIDNIQAFYVPLGTFVKIEPLIAHGRQFVKDKDEAHLLCLLPQRTFNNDMIAKFLNPEEQVEIIFD
ncbi:MAG: hypothetical protein LBT43_09240 [Prevotella sp.]|jgi:ureidoglycolate lyase|nr:hypothetical protein [Prevotella sp.]